jgi:DNA-binding MarR family transcriptional regulator
VLEVAAAMAAEDSLRIIEGALAIVVAWASRQDIQDEALRRARFNLPRGYATLLSRLSVCGPLRIGELAVLLGIDNSTLTPQIQRLERAGFIAREPDPHDRRAAVLRVTEEGEQLLAQLQLSWRDLLREKLLDWSDSDRAAVAAALSRLATTL